MNGTFAHRLGASTGAGGLSWKPPRRPEAWTIDLAMTVDPFAERVSESLGEAIEVDVVSPRFAQPPPPAVSIGIAALKLRTRSFAFTESGGTSLFAAPPDGSPKAGLAGPSSTAALWDAGTTRIRPPADIIKLEDRLHYLLQPSLQSLLVERSLEFPFHPFPYQFEGVAFLYPRHAAILADEMGLGKTMQAITAIRLLLCRGEVGSVLLVCPKPLVTNWQREFAAWAPEIPVLVIEGNQERRRWLWNLPDAPVKIANYELLCRDADVFNPISGEGAGPPRFDLAVLDEAQRIKNRSSTTNQVVCSLPRRRSWALTGTPIENSVDDLFGIFDFLVPGFLSPNMKPRRVGMAVDDYVLRRTKDEVLEDLPPKLFRDADLELTQAQRESYRLAEEEGVIRLAGMGREATIQHVFELVLRLKQICNFDPPTGASSKLERLEADLEEVAASGRKAIVFSQWVDTIERLAEHLGRFGPLEYHGKIPQRRREAVISRFRDDADRHVMLMSYGAGGVGLNLQFAGYVFLFDRWWNPAVEDQAINRAHRLGTPEPVTVSRFLVRDSIEERIDRVLQEKRELFDLVLSGAESPGKRGLTHDELFGLFDLQSPNGPVRWAA